MDPQEFERIRDLITQADEITKQSEALRQRLASVPRAVDHWPLRHRVLQSSGDVPEMFNPETQPEGGKPSE